MEDLLFKILIHGDSAIAWIGGILAVWILKLVHTLIKHKKWAALASRVIQEVFDACSEVWLAYVKPLKAANDDSKLTKDEKKEAKDQAIKKAKELMGADNLLQLGKALGEEAVDAWLGNKVESSVNTLKTLGKAAENGGKVSNPLP